MAEAGRTGGMMRTIRAISYDGDEDKYIMWITKWKAQANAGTYRGIVGGTTIVPAASVVLLAAGVNELAARNANQAGYDYLILCMEGQVPYNIVYMARTPDLPSGDLQLALSRLAGKYSPSTGADIVEIKREFTQSRLTSWKRIRTFG